jgi:hypothetical protein
MFEEIQISIFLFFLVENFYLSHSLLLIYIYSKKLVKQNLNKNKISLTKILLKYIKAAFA